MGFRFQKRIRIFTGLTLNLSKSGTSWTLGGRGASVNLKDGKATGSVWIAYRLKAARVDPVAASVPWSGSLSYWPCWGSYLDVDEIGPNLLRLAVHRPLLRSCTRAATL
jgi:hypothetical protein